MDTQDGITILQWINIFLLFDLCAIAIGATVYQLTGDRTVRVGDEEQIPVPKVTEDQKRRAA